MKVLFVGARPNDIEIFCGGAAALYAKHGHQVFFCVSTNGNVGSATLPPRRSRPFATKEAENGAAWSTKTYLGPGLRRRISVRHP